MPWKGLPPPRAMPPSNGIWISDQLLEEAFRRFSLTCWSKRGLSSSHCVRSKKPDYVGTARACRTFPRQCPDSLRPSLPQRDRVQDSAPLEKSQSNLNLHHGHRRYAHNVPGPLEARRRSARRRLNLAAGGVQSGASVLDAHVFFDDFWGRPKQPYWEWQPPRKMQLQEPSTKEAIKRNPLPWYWDIGVQHGDVNAIRKRKQPDGIESLSILRQQGRRHDVRDSEITTIYGLEARLAKTRTVKEVTAVYTGLPIVHTMDPTFGTLTFEHLISMYLDRAEQSTNADTDTMTGEMLDFAFGTGHWLSIAYHLEAYVKEMMNKRPNRTRARALLEFLKKSCERGPHPEEVVLPLLRMLDSILPAIDLTRAEEIELLAYSIDDLMSQSMLGRFDHILNLGRQLQSQGLVVCIGKHVTNSIYKARPQDAWVASNAQIIVNGLVALIDRSKLVSKVMRHKPDSEMSQFAFEVLAIAKELSSSIQFDTMQATTLLGIAMNRNADYTTDFAMRLWRILLDDTNCDMRLLRRLASKLLTQSPVSFAETEALYVKERPAIAQLLDHADPMVAHSWFLQVAEGFLHPVPEDNEDRSWFLSRWLLWSSHSKNIRQAQRELENPMVQDFFFRTFAVYRPSQVPHCLTMLEPHEACEVLLRHVLVQSEFSNSKPTNEIAKDHHHRGAESVVASHPNRIHNAWTNGNGPTIGMLQSLSQAFQKRLIGMQREWQRETQKALESDTTSWLPLNHDVRSSTYSFGKIYRSDTDISRSKSDVYNKDQSILRSYPEGMLSYLAFIVTLRAYKLPPAVIETILLEIVSVLRASRHQSWIYSLLLGVQSHGVRLTPALEKFIAAQINTSGTYYPRQALGLLNKCHDLWLDQVPNLLEELISSPISKVHHKRILAIFWYLERDAAPKNADQALIAESANRPLSDTLVSQIHNACLFFANASRFSARCAFHCIERLYEHLQAHNAAIDSRVSRALVIAGVKRQIAGGSCYKIPGTRFRWILKVVAEVEGKDVADQIDIMARKAELAESARYREAQMRRFRKRQGVTFYGKLGSNLGPRIEDMALGQPHATRRHRQSIVSWAKRQRSRERQAGVERPLKKADRWKNWKGDTSVGGHRYLWPPGTHGSDVS